MFDAIVVSGSWETVGAELRRRYEGLLDRVACYWPLTLHERSRWARLAAAFGGGP